eukprot:7408274-Pyramimonas_sp.AAC.1
MTSAWWTSSSSKIGDQLIVTTMNNHYPNGDYNTRARMNKGQIYEPFIHVGVFEKFFSVQIPILNYSLRWEPYGIATKTCPSKALSSLCQCALTSTLST